MEQANLARWRGVRTALFAVETDVGAFCNRFYAKTLEGALAWCLVWLMAPEIGVGPFRV